MIERYSIYDSNNGLFDDEIITYAKNATEAVRQYMNDNNIQGIIKRDGGNDVRFKATKTKIVEGNIYKTGKIVWFKYTA